MDKIELRTERLVLSAPTFADLDAIFDACQDVELQRRVPVPVPYGREDAEYFVRELSDEGWERGTHCTWAVRADGVFAGVVSLDGIRQGLAVVGFWMAPAFRRQGLLTEALTEALSFGFADQPDGLSLERVGWHAFTGNLASARVAQKVGFRFEGTNRQGLVGRDGREDVWIAGVLSEDDRTASTPWPMLA
ncbi:MAG: acetyltransferase [Aeromicrobium sp.]|nr:acetyltransferase [Aeromicrobium sp.]